jgi:hypothetical protein
VAHLPLAHELREHVELLALGHTRIDPVQLPQVDAVELEALKAPVELAAEVIRPTVRRPSVRPRPLEAALRGDDELLGVGVQRFGDELFRDVRAVRGCERSRG